MTDVWIQMMLALGGVVIVARAARGIILRRFTSYGRTGRARTYEGTAAVRQGIFEVVVGVLFILFAAYVWFMRPP